VRTPLVVGNWKMHKTVAESLDFARALAAKLAGLREVEVGVAPPFTALAPLRDALAGTPIALCAQNVHAEKQGAFTGEVSVPMLAELGVRYVIVGHSERRQLFGETDEQIARKVAAVHGAGLRPILCVGELLAERESGRTFDVLARQIAGSLAGCDRSLAPSLVVAYEPVWAIGTGRTATPAIAQEAHAFLRVRLADLFGAAAAEIRIQYGGSVKPDNAAELLAQPDIDGALVGGASLDPEGFSAIIRSRAR
jgi:triosephosphate isomerase (TIM)